nr:immunoglobulin heavy chain junction region [Mus musculus]
CARDYYNSSYWYFDIW